MKYDIATIRNWSEAGNVTGAETVLEMCDELKQLRAKLDTAVEALEEYTKPSSYTHPCVAEEALAKIRGEK